MPDARRFVATASAYDLPEPSFDADLVLVDRGTPMGELLRRYWHPVLKSDKLTDLPVKVKALGDDIVLFRKPTGEVGAMYPRCVHRGTDLLYGKVTESGLRCCYHGWTFDTDGRCMAQPTEPNDGGKGRNAVRQPWYPVEERYGLIFVYMGPPDRKPPLPRFDVLDNIPDGWVLNADDTTIPSAGAGYMPCNWLQHHENGMDPAHVAIVHEHQFPPIMASATNEFQFFKDDDRVRGHGITKFGPMVMDMKVDMILPTIRVIPDPLLANPRPDGKGDSVAWTLPKDNTDTIVFTVIATPKDAFQPSTDLYNGKKWPDLTFEEHQRFPGDFEAQVGQGEITYHSQEHLVSSDKGIVFLRRLYRAAIKEVREGRDPPLAFGPEAIFVDTWAGIAMSQNPDFVDREADAITSSAEAGQSDAEIEGSWDLTMQTPMGEQKVRLALAVNGGMISGIMSIEGEDDVTIKEATANGAAVRWQADVAKPFPMTMTYDVIVEGNTLSGTFKPGMFPASPVTGVRHT